MMLVYNRYRVYNTEVEFSVANVSSTTTSAPVFVCYASNINTPVNYWPEAAE